MSSALPTTASASTTANANEIGVLFVDLDGSLIGSNMLVETYLRAIRHDPLVLVKTPLWLLEGRTAFKCHVAEYPLQDVSGLPYRPEVMTTLQALKREGFRLVLATASHRTIADQVAKQVGLFDDVLATDEHCNLKGRNKLKAIQEYCRQHGFNDFAYLGDAWADMPIWEQAAKIYVVSPSGRMSRRLVEMNRPVETLVPRRGQWKAYLKALRPHQWMKNVLVFLPAFLAHNFTFWPMAYALVAFISFSACASAVYLLNDLLDLDADRRHPTKCRRPFASGRVPLEMGLVAAPLLVLFGLGLSWFTTSTRFPLMLLFYLISSGLYCFWLKRVALVDVFLLSGLYMLRVQAGGTASGVEVSEWLLIFSLFFFLSLAFAKRFVELDRLELSADSHDTGRGYRMIDVASLSAMGSAAGYIAVVVLALYINSLKLGQLDGHAKALYAHPKVLCALCPILLFWMSRLWMLARRNELHDDPVVFALKDRASQLLGLLSVVTVVLAGMLH
ncbi:MAG TPA: UbiA family prenyltransferase [Pirellulales bacterium]|jgi:4-hydroxybenzoate polyprenyltransferase